MLPAEFLELVEGIERALFVFESTSNQAVLRLYRRNTPTHGLDSSMTASRASIASMTDENENPLTVGTDNENVFLVYL